MKVNTVERPESTIISSSAYNKENMALLLEENSRLNLMFDLHNRILEEYQLKHGNELFEDIKKCYKTTQESPMYLQVKRDFIENISIIREYENEIANKDNIIDSLNMELGTLKAEVDRFIDQDKDSRQKIATLMEEKAQLLKNVLMNPKSSDLPKFGSKTASNFHGRSESPYNTQLRAPEGIQDYEFKRYSNLMEQQKEELLSLVEKYKLENDQLKVACQSLSDRCNELQGDFDFVSKEFNIYKNQNEDFLAMRDNFTVKIKKYNSDIGKLENEVEDLKIQLEQNVSDESILKRELKFYKENYDELESRKNNEIESLIRDMSESKLTINDLNERILILEQDNSALKFENSRLRQELMNSKDDVLQLTKVLEDSNKIVRAVKEKEKLLDQSLRNNKRKIEEANTEKEKSLLRVRLLEQQLQKLNNDYNKVSQERQEKYENFLESMQSKYALISASKDDKLRELKDSQMSLEMERDKLKNDYTFTKKEYDKLLEIFREENSKYIFKFETSEKRAIQTQDELFEKMNDLAKKNEKLEHEKSIAERELQILQSNDKNRDYIISKLTSVDDSKGKENLKLKEKFDIVLVEKEELEKEIDRLKNLYEAKIFHLKEQFEMKSEVLSKSLTMQKKQFSETEEKAFEMLKKQEQLTEKFKCEYSNTINYLLSQNEKLVKENSVLRKHVGFDAGSIENN